MSRKQIRNRENMKPDGKDRWSDGHGSYIWLQDTGMYLLLVNGKQMMVGFFEDALEAYERG